MPTAFLKRPLLTAFAAALLVFLLVAAVALHADRRSSETTARLLASHALLHALEDALILIKDREQGATVGLRLDQALARARVLAADTAHAPELAELARHLNAPAADLTRRLTAIEESERVTLRQLSEQIEDNLRASGQALLAIIGFGLLLLVLAFRNAYRELAMRQRQERALNQRNAELQREIAAHQKTGEALRSAHEATERKNAELLRAARLKGEFLATMTHELKTPLNAILGFSEILHDGVVGEISPRQKENLDYVLQAARDLLALINDLLDISHLEAGHFTYTPEECVLPALLDSILAERQDAAQGRQITLGGDIDLPDEPVWIEAQRVRQILAKLLANALRFTPAGGTVSLRARRVPRAELSQAPQEETAEYLLLAVSDSGPGLAPEIRDRLFEPFAMLDASLTRAQGGAGLGLALVRRLTLRMGGALAVDSAADTGTCFSVWLPWHVPAGHGSAPAFASAPLLRALVVEDDDMAAELIRSQLAADGIEVVRARSAEEALHLAASERPDLFTVDILLPGIDGWELLTRLKHDPQLADVPVVIISIIADTGKGLSLGAAKVLQKPYQRQELEAALATLDFSRADGQPATVLLVDDDPLAMTLFATHLEQGHYRVLRASGGAEGLALARSTQPDLIVLDLLMPEISGFEVAERLKEDPATAAIPILVVTAKTLTAEDRAALNGNALRIMEKARFDHGRFINEVRRALRRHPQPAPDKASNTN